MKYNHVIALLEGVDATTTNDQFGKAMEPILTRLNDGYEIVQTLPTAKGVMFILREALPRNTHRFQSRNPQATGPGGVGGGHSRLDFLSGTGSDGSSPRKVPFTRR